MSWIVLAESFLGVPQQDPDDLGLAAALFWVDVKPPRRPP
jgi:hypothetical protein